MIAIALLAACLAGCAAAPVTAPSPRHSAVRVPINERALLPHVEPDASSTNGLNCPRRARACVDVRRGLAWLQSHGRTTYGPVRVATGTRGHATPRGNFTVQWKARHWTSTEYGLPMPYSVFFATGGIAFHAGPLDQHSHGCVHLARNAARTFFHRLPVGAHVHVA